MTDNKQIARERDWVKARLNCSVDAIFETLVDVIQSDVAVFNNLTDQDEATVNRLKDKDRAVTITRGKRVAAICTDGKAIQISSAYNECPLADCEVRPKWNEATMACDLFIGDEKLSIHRVSQRAIGDVLFP